MVRLINTVRIMKSQVSNIPIAFIDAKRRANYQGYKMKTLDYYFLKVLSFE